MSKLILYGDSIFFGVGASNRQNSCAKLLKKKSNIPVIIKSKLNLSTEEAVECLDKLVLSDNATYVIVLFGNNDCRITNEGIPYVEPLRYRKNLKTIIERVRDNSKHPFLCNLPPLNDELVYKSIPHNKNFIFKYKSPSSWQGNYNAIIEKVAYESEVPLINIRKLLELRINETIHSDGLHPNDYGHALIADTIYAQLKKHIEI